MKKSRKGQGARELVKKRSEGGRASEEKIAQR